MKNASNTCTGDSVMPSALQPNFLEMCLLLPPMPQPTSTICKQSDLQVSFLALNDDVTAQDAKSDNVSRLPCNIAEHHLSSLVYTSPS